MLINNNKTINAWSDIPTRVLFAMILVPLFLCTTYTWIIESMIHRSLTVDDISWLAVNASGLIALILGSLFMRGHNNRNVIVYDALQPALYWGMLGITNQWLSNMHFPDFMQFGVFAQLEGKSLPYIAYALFSVLWVVSIAGLYTRVHWETRFNYHLGKKIPKLRDTVMKTVASKGTTNFQNFMLVSYTVYAMMWFSVSAWYIVFGAIADIPFMVENMSFADAVDEYTGIGYYYIVDSLHNVVAALFAIGIVLHVAVDYFYPDKVGSNTNKVPNMIGNGSKKLIYSR